MIVITDGKQSGGHEQELKVKKEADDLRAQDFTIIAVTLTKFPSWVSVLKNILWTLFYQVFPHHASPSF